MATDSQAPEPRAWEPTERRISQMVTNNFLLPPSDSATCSACSLQTPPKPYSTLFSVIAPCRIPYLGNNSITCRRLFRRFSTHPDPQTTPRRSDSFRTSELSTCHLRAGPTDSEISSGFLVACLLGVESFSRSNSLFSSARTCSFEFLS